MQMWVILNLELPVRYHYAMMMMMMMMMIHGEDTFPPWENDHSYPLTAVDATQPPRNSFTFREVYFIMTKCQQLFPKPPQWDF